MSKYSNPYLVHDKDSINQLTCEDALLFQVFY